MKKSSTLRTWLPVAIAALLIAAVFATGFLHKQKTWIEMIFFNDFWFENGQSVSLENGDAYGVMDRGPDLTLPAGTYRIKYIVDTDGENRIHLATSNNARIVPEDLPVPANGWQTEMEFTLLDPAETFEIQAVFENGTYMHVYDFRLYSPWYSDNQFTLAFIVAGLCALWVMHSRGTLTSGRKGRLLIIGFAVMIASIPALKENLSISHDVLYHMARVMNLADSLANGQFPARMGGFSYNGYGAITSVFYPDLFMVPFSLMSLAGASIQYCIHLYTIALNIATGWTMYVCAKRIFGDRDVATCASVLYTLAVYRVMDVYVRLALGEATAMAVLPLFLLGLWEVVFGDKSRWKLLAVSAACVCQSHLITTLMCALLALGVCVLFIVRIAREKRLLSLIKAAVVAALLCAFWFAPFLMYSADGITADAIRISGQMEMRAISPGQLLLWGEGELPKIPKDWAVASVPIEIGPMLLLGVLILLYLYMTSVEERDNSTGYAVLFALAGGMAAFMATTMFPWSYVNKLTRDFAEFIQFPWRFLMFTDALFALAAACAYIRFAGKHVQTAVFAVLLVSALLVMPTVGGQMRAEPFYEFGQGAQTSIPHPEYQLPDTNVQELADRSWHAEGDVSVTEYEKNGVSVTAHVDAREDAKLSLPMFGFRGYAIEVDGQRMDWELGENNRMVVLLPAGTNGTLHVRFVGERIWRVFDAVSLVTLLALIANAVLKKRRVKGRTGVASAS